MYKIKLNDGTVLENLELNGNNYISENVVESGKQPCRERKILVYPLRENRTGKGNRAAVCHSHAEFHQYH